MSYEPKNSKRAIGRWRNSTAFIGGFEIISNIDGKTLACCRIYKTGKNFRAIAWLRDSTKTFFHRGISAAAGSECRAILAAFADANVPIPETESFYTAAQHARNALAAAFDLNPFLVDFGA